VEILGFFQYEYGTFGPGQFTGQEQTDRPRAGDDDIVRDGNIYTDSFVIGGCSREFRRIWNVIP
jgi:hypothetical protein